MSLAFGFALPHWQALSAGFNPISMFAGGVQGVLYDPSDLTTLFTTSSGTTPVSMPGQGLPAADSAVGLMLDKSQGLVLGPELVTNGDFSIDSNWTKSSTTISGGSLNFSGVAVAAATQAGIFVASRLYELVLDIATATAGTLLILSGTGQQVAGASFTTSGVKRLFVRPNTTGTLYIYTNTSFVGTVNSISVRELPGNHAIAINDSTARPVLSARVNLLTYSEEFQNAAWTLGANISAFGSGSVVNATTAPNNTTTADLLTENLNTGDRSILQLVTSSFAVVQSIYVKPNGRTWAYFQMSYTGGTPPVVADRRVWFNCVGSGSIGTVGTQYSSPSITALSNGWYRISAVINPASTGSTGTNFIFGFTTADATVSYTGDGTSGMYWWGADLRPANIGANVPAYQRIADADTYDTNGFPLYLRFDGIDDGMYTPANLDLSGTDKVAVFAGVRKLTDTTGFVAETSSDAAANNGAFYQVVVPASRWEVQLRGTASSASALSTYAVPITNVLSTQYDIGASGVANEIVPRVNATTPTRTNFGSDCGTGNFGTYPLYIGSRANSTFWFQGQVYGLVIVGSAVSAGNISATESWMAGKTGIQI